MGSQRIRTPEPLWYLKSVPYGVYLTTDHWVLLKEDYKNHLKESGDGALRCMRCGIESIGLEVWADSEWVDEHGVLCAPSKAGAWKRTERHSSLREPQWNVHHLTYERLGEEEFEDLELLCVMCHNLEHKPESHAAQYWVKHLQGRSYLHHLVERLERGE